MHTVLPPIPTKSLTSADVEELTRSTREKMLKELMSLTESEVGQKAAKPLIEHEKRTEGVKVQ